jgi:FkbM family methyltransferase
VFARALLRKGDLVLDIGANIGVYTVVAARRGARVVAFEPNAKARAALQANVALNGIAEEVQISSHALADFIGPARLTTELEECNHLELRSSATGDPVAVHDLDSLEWIGGPVTLIKIDVEGFDEAVLRGARLTLVRDRPVLIIETWAGGLSIREFLSPLGYVFFTYEGGTLRPLPKDFTQDANLIAIHPENAAWVRSRLGSPKNEPLPGPRARWVLRPARAPQPAPPVE